MEHLSPHGDNKSHEKEIQYYRQLNPQRHYMVNSERRFRAVETLIDSGEYFTLNRAQQYGKTTRSI